MSSRATEPTLDLFAITPAGGARRARPGRAPRAVPDRRPPSGRSPRARLDHGGCRARVSPSSPSIASASFTARPRRAGWRLLELGAGEPITRIKVAPSSDDLLHRVLAVLGRVADVVGTGPLEAAEPAFEHGYGRRDVVERERRLADHGQRLSLGVELLGVLGRLDDDDLVRAARPSSRSPRRGRRGRRARRDDRSRHSGAPPRAPSRRVDRRRRRRAAPGGTQFSSTAGATPCAESTQISPAGISSSESTNTAPMPSSRRTTLSLWTISCRT